MVPYLRGLPHVFLILWIFGWAGGQSTISSDAGVSSTLVAGPSSSTPMADSTLQPSPSSLELSTQSPPTSALSMNATVSPQDTVSPSVALVSTVSQSVSFTAVPSSHVELSSSLEPTKTSATLSSVLSFSSSVALSAANTSSSVPSVFDSVQPSSSFVSDSVSTPTATTVTMPDSTSAAYLSSKSFAVASSSYTPVQSAQITPTPNSVMNSLSTSSLNEATVQTTTGPSSSVTDSNITSFLPSATSVQSTKSLLDSLISASVSPTLEPSSMAVQSTKMLFLSTSSPFEIMPSSTISGSHDVVMPTTILTSPSTSTAASSAEVATPVSMSIVSAASFSSSYNLTSTPAAAVLNISSTPTSSFAVILTSGLTSSGTTVAPSSDITSPAESAQLLTLTSLPFNTTETPSFAVTLSPGITATVTTSVPATNLSASVTPVPSLSYSPSSEATSKMFSLTSFSTSELSPSETSVVNPSYLSFTESFMLSLSELSMLETKSLYQTPTPSPAVTTLLEPASSALQSLALPASSLRSSSAVPTATVTQEVSKPLNLQTETVSESLPILETLSLDLLSSESLQMTSTPSVQNLSALQSSEAITPSETVRLLSSLSVESMTAFPSSGALPFVSAQPTTSVQSTFMPSLQNFTLLPSLEMLSLTETLQMTSSPLQMTIVLNTSAILPTQTIQPSISEIFSDLPTLSESGVGMPTSSFDIVETLNVTELVSDTASFLSLPEMLTFTPSVLDLIGTRSVTETPSLLLNMSSVTLAPSTPDLTLLSLYDPSILASETVSINITEFLFPSDSLVDLITLSSPPVELSETPSMSTNGSVEILPSQTISSVPLVSPSPIDFSESISLYTPTSAASETLAISRNLTSNMGTASASFSMGLPPLSALPTPSMQLSVIATSQPMRTEMITSIPQSEALLLPSSGAVVTGMSSLGTMLQYETTSTQVFEPVSLQTLDISTSYAFSDSSLAPDMTSQVISSPSVTLEPSGSSTTSGPVQFSPTLQSSSSSSISMSSDDFEGSGSDLPFLSQTLPMLTQTASATSLQLSPSYSVDSFSSTGPSSIISASFLQPSYSPDQATTSLTPTTADTLGSSVSPATATQGVAMTMSLQPSPSQSYIIDSFSPSGSSQPLSLTPSYTPDLASFSLPLLSTMSLPVQESSSIFDGSGDGPVTDLIFSSSPSVLMSSQTPSPSISLDFVTSSTPLGTTIQPTASVSAPTTVQPSVSLSVQSDSSVMTSFTLDALSMFSSIKPTQTPEGSGDMDKSQFLQLESTPSISLSSIPVTISSIFPMPSFSMDFPTSTNFFESTQFEGSGMSISEAFSETMSFTVATSFDSMTSTPTIPPVMSSSSQVGTPTSVPSPSLQETVTPSSSVEEFSLPPFTAMSSMFLESTSLVLLPSPSLTVDLLPSMSTKAVSSSGESVLVSSTAGVMSSVSSSVSQQSMMGVSSSSVQPTSSITASQSVTPTPVLPTTSLVSASPLESSGSAVTSSAVPTASLSSSLLSSTAVMPSLPQIPSLLPSTALVISSAGVVSSVAIVPSLTLIPSMVAPSSTAVVVSSSAVVVVSSSAVVTTQVPTTQAPTTQAPTTQEPTTQPPTTQAPTTQPPTTQAPTTQPPTTQAATTPSPTTRGPAATTFNYVTANLSVELVSNWVITVLVIPDAIIITSEQFYFTMEINLARAFARARQRKAGMDVAQNPILRRKRAATFENVTCQVINATRDNTTGRNDRVSLTYYVMYDGKAVPASQAVADLALLDEQELALQLGYFVAQTEEYEPVAAPSEPPYWIIAAVLGPLFIIIIIVIWLVCCCKRTKRTEMAPDTVGELQKKGTPRGVAPAEMQKKVMTDTLIPPGSYVVKVPEESRDAPPLPARRGRPAPQPRRSSKAKDRRQKSSKRRSKRRSTEESEDSSFTSVTEQSSKPRSKRAPESMLESDTGDDFPSDAGSKAGLFEHVAKLSAVIEPTPQKPASRAFHSSVHPIKFPPLRTPLVTDRLRESIKENQQLSQSMRQKADIEHWRNKQLQRERSLRRKPTSPRGGYEHTAVGDTKDQRRAYRRAQQQIDSVLEPSSHIPAVLEPPRRRRMKRPHKRHGSHDIQGVTSPHDPELAMQFGQQPQGVYRPMNGVPPLGPQPLIPGDSEGRSVEDESYTESDPETMPISQARERIHQLLDEAFSLISPSVPPRNSVAPAPNVTTVQPVQSAPSMATPQYAQPAGNGQVPNGMGGVPPAYMTPQAAYPQDLRTPQGPVPPPAHGRASTAGPRARRRFNGQSASSSDREPAGEQPLFTRQPTVVFSPDQYQQAAAGRAPAPDPRARTSQAAPASVNMGTPQQPLFVTPVQQKPDGSGGVLWSLYNAEDEVAKMSQSREPTPLSPDDIGPLEFRLRNTASLPGGLDASPLLSRLQSTPMTRTSSLPSVTPPHFTPSQTTTFPAPSPIGQSGYGSPFIGQPGTSPGSHPGMRTPGQSAFTPVRSSPGSDQSGAGSNPPSQLDDSRLRPGQDPDADEVDIMSGLRTGDSAQPLIQAIKDELKRLSGKTPVTTL
ncbi:uncharacterized protein LOC144910387 isoform X2 [Branchiostoma floridae x Branchiostoma belcheri]